jgi:hypothetical protein
MKLQFAETFFYCPQALTLATDLPTEYRVATIAHILNKADPEAFPVDRFYLFGWSGLLTPENRLHAAERFYDALYLLQQQYPHEPIRIITHSHGGNMVLNIAHFFEKKEKKIEPIDELILFACPVQQNTAHYTTHQTFKRILSFHSTLDMFQVIDPQGLYTLKGLIKQEGFYQTFSYLKQMWPLFSQRHFPDKHVQHIRVSYHNRGLTHIEFLLRDFLQHLPAILTFLEHHPELGSYTFGTITIHREHHAVTKITE